MFHPVITSFLRALYDVGGGPGDTDGESTPVRLLDGIQHGVARRIARRRSWGAGREPISGPCVVAGGHCGRRRGRLSRGAGPNYCYLVADPATTESEQRLAAMVASDDGFVLAEEDLRIRGQGTVFGARQAGAADLRIADILRDTRLLIDARREAFALVAADPGLSNHGDVASEVQALLGDDVAWLFAS